MPLTITPEELAVLHLTRGATGAIGEFQAGRSNSLISAANQQSLLTSEEDARSRGRERISKERKKTKKTIGSQRASLAAQGINVNTGSSIDIQRETEEVGEEEVRIIKNNATRDAYGFKVAAVNERLQEKLGRISSRVRAVDAIASAGLAAAGVLAGGAASTKTSAIKNPSGGRL